MSCDPVPVAAPRGSTAATSKRWALIVLAASVLVWIAVRRRQPVGPERLFDLGTAVFVGEHNREVVINRPPQGSSAQRSIEAWSPATGRSHRIGVCEQAWGTAWLTSTGVCEVIVRPPRAPRMPKSGTNRLPDVSRVRCTPFAGGAAHDVVAVPRIGDTVPAVIVSDTLCWVSLAPAGAAPVRASSRLAPAAAILEAMPLAGGAPVVLARGLPSGARPEAAGEGVVWWDGTGAAHGWTPGGEVVGLPHAQPGHGVRLGRGGWWWVCDTQPQAGPSLSARPSVCHANRDGSQCQVVVPDLTLGNGRYVQSTLETHGSTALWLVSDDQGQVRILSVSTKEPPTVREMAKLSLAAGAWCVAAGASGRNYYFSVRHLRESGSDWSTQPGQLMEANDLYRWTIRDPG